MSRLFFLLLALGLAARADDWPQWLGPQRDGVSQETGWNKDWSKNAPGKLWEIDLGAGASAVAVAKGRLYTAGNDRAEADSVFCLDPSTGEKIWTFSYPCPYKARMFDGGTAATPTVDGERIYFGSYHGLILCLSREGKELWRKHLVDDLGGEMPHWGYAASPLVLGGMVFVDPGGKGGTIVALDKVSGQTLWKAGKSDSAYSSLSAFGTDAVLALSADGLLAAKLADGKEVFHAPWKTQYDINVVVPLVKGGEIFLSSGYGKGAGLFRWDGQSISLVYENKELFTQFQNAVRVGEQIYGVHGDNSTKAELRCLDWSTGQLRWKQRLIGNRGTLTCAEGHLLVLTERGQLLLVKPSPERYQELGKVQVLHGRCWTPPVLANGKIYCRNTSGTLVAYDVSGS